MAEARAAFFAEQLKDVPLADVVLTDESYATTQFTRPRGRARRGERVVEHVPHGHWKRLTLTAAMTVAGPLVAAAVDASTDRDVYLSFVSDFLCPALRPGQVVVMDNLSSHKVAGVRAAIEAAGCRLVYLPPYSPDLRRDRADVVQGQAGTADGRRPDRAGADRRDRPGRGRCDGGRLPGLFPPLRVHATPKVKML